MKEEIKNLEDKCIRYMVERDRTIGENEVLKERIDKAIEYIENNDDEWFSAVELIGILQGSDKDE